MAIKQSLEEYSKDIKALININPKQFDIVRIATMINALPERKWNAAQSVVLNTIKYKAAVREAKTIRATQLLRVNQSQNKKNLSNAADRSAWVDSQPDVQNAETTVIDTEAELLSAKLAYDCLDDLFTAGKKIMDYLVEEERATKQYGNYALAKARNK